MEQPWTTAYVQRICMLAIPVGNSKSEIASKFTVDNEGCEVTTFQIVVACPLSARVIDVPCRISECPIEHLFDATSFLKAYGEYRLASLDPTDKFAGMHEGDPKCPKCPRPLRFLGDLVYERYISDLIREKKYNEDSNILEFYKNGAEVGIGKPPWLAERPNITRTSPCKIKSTSTSARLNSNDTAVFVNNDSDDDDGVIFIEGSSISNRGSSSRYAAVNGDSDDGIEILEHGF